MGDNNYEQLTPGDIAKAIAEIAILKYDIEELINECDRILN